MKTLFPPYAQPSPDLRPDADTWVVQERPGPRRSGHQVLGRVDLDWGGRSLADVLADVDVWREDGAQGLFLDRAPAGSSGVGPVALTVRLAARRGLHRVVLNPGVPTHPLYRDLGVRICTFDGPWSAYQGWDGDGGQTAGGRFEQGEAERFGVRGVEIEIAGGVESREIVVRHEAAESNRVAEIEAVALSF